MNICAILPIKHNSERVPGKNYRNFCGKPLFTYILNTLLECTKLDKIVVDTNSETVKDYIAQHYNNNKITIYNRPEHLWDGNIPMNLILENVIVDQKLDYDYYLQTHTTNPLLTIDTLNEAISKFLNECKNGFDSLFSVKQLNTRLYYKRDSKVIAINHNPNELKPTQDLEPIYEENSCIYMFSKDNLLKKKHRIGYNPYIFIMNDIESSDIDTESDFTIAENLYARLIMNYKKVVLITGATGGIGVEISKKFKNMGWIVVGTSIEKEYTSKYLDNYKDGNLSSEDDIKNIIDFVEKKYGKINCLVNNAANQICKPIWEMSSVEWDAVYTCNVKSIFLLVKYGLSLLSKVEGNIINVGSVHSICTSDEIAAYASTKSAIVGLTKNLSIELSKYNIRVNCISPGAVDTPMLRSGLLRGHITGKDSNELIKKLGEKHLLNRVGKPEEIANLIEFIGNSNNGEFINGSNLIIDGGASIKLSTE